MVEQAEAVKGRVPVGERLPVELRLAKAALVPRDHPMLRSQRLHLRLEHLAVHQEAVRQDDSGTVPSTVVKPQPLTVDLSKWHGSHPRPGPEVSEDSNRQASRPNARR